MLVVLASEGDELEDEGRVGTNVRVGDSHDPKICIFGFL
jgi:hypothetical protein